MEDGVNTSRSTEEHLHVPHIKKIRNSLEEIWMMEVRTVKVCDSCWWREVRMMAIQQGLLLFDTDVQMRDTTERSLQHAWMFTSIHALLTSPLFFHIVFNSSTSSSIFLVLPIQHLPRPPPNVDAVASPPCCFDIERAHLLLFVDHFAFHWKRIWSNLQSSFWDAGNYYHNTAWTGFCDCQTTLYEKGSMTFQSWENRFIRMNGGTPARKPFRKSELGI